MTCPSGAAHYWAMAMQGNIMSREAWQNSMGRTARCMICGKELRGYEAAMAIKAQREAANL